MKLKFKTMQDLLSFTKKALYMTDKKTLQKILKWKQNGELICHGDNDGYTLTPRETSESDKAFNIELNIKYIVWKKTDKQSTIDHQKPL